MSLRYSKKELKFLKSLRFWEFRTKVLEYVKIGNYALTVFWKDGRVTLLEMTLADLENQFEFTQFVDWIFVMCKKYKKTFKKIELQENPETKKKEFINLFIS